MGAVAPETYHRVGPSVGLSRLSPRSAISLSLGCVDLLPLPLLQSARVVPVYVSADGRTLHLAFGERLDHTTLYAVEQMLGSRTFACIADELSVRKALRVTSHAPVWRQSFDTMRDPREIAQHHPNYAGEYRALHIAVARASAYLWVRFSARAITRDFSFASGPQPTPSVSSPGYP